MVASEVNRRQIDFAKADEETLQRMKLVQKGTPLSEALAGLYLTASLEVKFLKPVLCPGVVGIETELLENKGRMMKMKATMKDGGGTPLLITSAVFVRLGAKL
jgi:acyl-CoA thioesterase FadM